MIRVLLAHDQALIRAGFRVLLDSAEDIEVVGEAENGAQAVTVARDRRADVVLMDIRMPTVDGLEATRRMVADENLAGVKVLILTIFESDEYVYEALRAGASGFLVKDTEPEGAAARDPSGRSRRCAAVTRCHPPADRRHRGARAIPRQPPPRVVGADRTRAGDDGAGRPRPVNDEIAAQLFLSPLTVKTHVSRAMLKLGARDRAQPVVIAYQSGLVTPGDGPRV